MPDLLNILTKAVGIQCEGGFYNMNPAGLDIFGEKTFGELGSRHLLEYLCPIFSRKSMETYSRSR